MIKSLVYFLALFAVVGCTFNIPDNTPLEVVSLSFRDTVSVWPAFTFELSRPIVDSFVELALIPDPGGGFYSMLSDDHKAIIFECNEHLAGSTKYTLTLKSEITAVNGKSLQPDDFLYSFTTYQFEEYPNETKELADTLFSVIYGNIDPITDVDYFVVTDSSLNSMVFTNLIGHSEILLSDSVGTEIYRYSGLDSSVSVDISNQYSYPVILRVSSIMDSNSRYFVSVTRGEGDYENLK